MSKNILVIEDNDQQATIIFESLSKAMPENTVHMVSHGGEGLDFLNNRPPYEKSPRPDLIFLDIKMPWCDGHEFLKLMKTDENLRSIPVIVMTTSGSQDDIKKAYDLGANCYITKPMSTKKFHAIVEVVNNFWFGFVSLPSGS